MILGGKALGSDSRSHLLLVSLHYFIVVKAYVFQLGDALLIPIELGTAIAHLCVLVLYEGM